MKKQLAVLTSALLLCGLMSACNASNTEQSEPQNKPSDHQTIGRVTAINGNEITISQGGPGGVRHDSAGKESASTSTGEAPDSSAAVQVQPPAESAQQPPEGESGNAEAPSEGETKQQPPEGMEQKTITITISDATEITRSVNGQTEGASKSDILLHSMLRITYEEDQSTVRSIVILDENAKDPNAEQGSAQTTPRGTTSHAVTSPTPTT